MLAITWSIVSQLGNGERATLEASTDRQRQGSDEGRQRDLLPPDKQFLITRNGKRVATVICVQG